MDELFVNFDIPVVKKYAKFFAERLDLKLIPAGGLELIEGKPAIVWAGLPEHHDYSTPLISEHLYSFGPEVIKVCVDAHMDLIPANAKKAAKCGKVHWPFVDMVMELGKHPTVIIQDAGAYEMQFFPKYFTIALLRITKERFNDFDADRFTFILDSRSELDFFSSGFGVHLDLELPYNYNFGPDGEHINAVEYIGKKFHGRCEDYISPNKDRSKIKNHLLCVYPNQNYIRGLIERADIYEIDADCISAGLLYCEFGEEPYWPDVEQIGRTSQYWKPPPETPAAGTLNRHDIGILMKDSMKSPNLQLVPLFADPVRALVCLDHIYGRPEEFESDLEALAAYGQTGIG